MKRTPDKPIAILAPPAPWLLLAVALTVSLVLLLVPPIPQDPGYHAFADQRTLWGIPHFWNVASNLPLLLVGGLGLTRVIRSRGPNRQHPLHLSHLILFLGIGLAAVGSIYYHLAPSNARLLWDRLPMTLGFMAFFSVVVGRYISEGWGRRLLWPLLAAGLLSVVYWSVTEARGAGDLRLYGLVQFLPLVLTPIVVLASPSRQPESVWIWIALAAYSASKLLELGDAEVYRIAGLSGHSLKHLAAAVGGLALVAAFEAAGELQHSYSDAAET